MGAIPGHLLFGVGTFIRLSGANRDLFWMLLVLYIAMLGQSFGEQYLQLLFWRLSWCNADGAQLRVHCPLTPAHTGGGLSDPGFLVPGARRPGLVERNQHIERRSAERSDWSGRDGDPDHRDYIGSAAGHIIISPHKFVPVTADTGRLRKR